MIQRKRRAAVMAIVVLSASAFACTNDFGELFSAAGSGSGDASPTIDGAVNDGAVSDGAIHEAEAATPDAAPPVCTPPTSGALASLFLPPSNGVVHHVDPGGDDNGPGTAAKPWRTVQNAVDTLKPGETAFVHGGIYPEFVVWMVSGTASAPITLQGDPAKPAIFTNQVQLRGQFTRVRGFVFDGTARANDVSLLSIRNADVEVSNNEFRAAKGPALEALTDNAVEPSHGRVWGNWFHDGARGVLWHAGIETIIASNLFHDHTDAAIVLDPTPQLTFVLSNTIARGRVGVVLGLTSGSASRSTSIINNLITNHTEQGVFAGNSNPGLARRNIFNANVSPTSASVTQSDNLVGVDPRYVAARDFHLQPTSPALRAADLSFTPPVDRDGRCRPVGEPDLGAFEQ